MAIDIQQFERAAASGEHLQADPADASRVTAASNGVLSRLGRALRGSGEGEKQANQNLRAAFLESLGEAYGPQFAESVAGQVAVESTSRLRSKTVQDLIEQGKAHREGLSAEVRTRAEHFSASVDVDSPDSFVSRFDRKAQEMGLTHPVSDMNVVRLQHAISHKITSEGNGGRVEVSAEDARRLADLELTKFVQNKLDLQQHVQGMGLSQGEQQTLTDFAMSHDIQNPEVLEKTWALRTEAQSLAAVLANPSATPADHLVALNQYQAAYDSALQELVKNVNPEEFGADDMLDLTSNAVELGLKTSGADVNGMRQLYDRSVSPEVMATREAMLHAFLNTEENGISMESATKLRTFGDTLAAVTQQAGKAAGLEDRAVQAANQVPESLTSLNQVSPEVMAAFEAAGLQDVRSPGIAAGQRPVTLAQSTLSLEKSVLGQSAQELVSEMDEQQSRLQRLQDRDAARLASLPEGAGKTALQDQMNQRAANMAGNDQFKARLNAGEHPTLVQADMARAGAILVAADDKARLEKAAAHLRPGAPAQEVSGVTLSPPSSGLSHPPPTQLPPLPPGAEEISADKPKLERSPSVREMMNEKKSVRNNPFKIQDEALKAAQKRPQEGGQKTGQDKGLQKKPDTGDSSGSNLRAK